MKRLAAFLFALAAFAASAANMTERSPFFQGHWWDPSRSGHGFEIFNADGHVMSIWYTYDSVGKPVWYTAQGTLAELGTASWPLQKHTWANGRIASSTNVGEMKLVVNHAEEISAQWRIGTTAGAWTLQPYLASSLVSEVDHTGHWFDPAQSGWGFTLTEQGDTMGSVLYAYDTAGQPTWVAGFDKRTGDRINFYTLTGTPPTASYSQPNAFPAGYIDFTYQGESRLTMRPSLSVPLAAGVRLDTAQAVQLGRPASMRAADRQLARFDSQALLKAYLDAGMLNAPAGGGGIDFSAPPPMMVFSPTNLQEEGVDEADFVKTDGRAVYAFRHSDSGAALPSIRYALLGADGASLGQRGTVDLLGGGTQYNDMAYKGLIAHGNRLVAISGTQPSSGFNPWEVSGVWTGGTTRVEVLDTTDTGAPVTRWRAQIEGHIVATRRVGDRLYVITRFVANLPGFQFGAWSDQLRATNRTLLAATPLQALMPRVTIDGGTPSALLDAASVYAPPTGARQAMPDLVTVTAIDLVTPRIVQSLAVAGGADTVYASPTTLYYASSRTATNGNFSSLQAPPPFYLTDVSRIALDPAGMTPAGTGVVEGYLSADPDMRPLRLSEKDGRIRVVTTSFGMWGGSASHRLTTLEASAVSPGLLRVVSFLPNATRPQPLGKPNEELKATRFVGDKLYAVTFRRVDPLYVVDMARPADPAITGLLEVPGFSEYLHPLPTGQLVGFGQDADANGFTKGLLLTLYNVDAAGVPAEVQRFSLGERGSYSALLDEPHAFSALMRADSSGTIAFPARIYNGPMLSTGAFPWNFSGVLRFDLQRVTSTEVRLAPVDFLVSHSVNSTAELESYRDPAVRNGRSILFPAGTVYVGDGKFWHQDAAGHTTGPY